MEALASAIPHRLLHVAKRPKNVNSMMVTAEAGMQ